MIQIVGFIHKINYIGYTSLANSFLNGWYSIDYLDVDDLKILNITDTIQTSLSEP